MSNVNVISSVCVWGGNVDFHLIRRDCVIAFYLRSDGNVLLHIGRLHYVTLRELHRISSERFAAVGDVKMNYFTKRVFGCVHLYIQCDISELMNTFVLLGKL